MYQTTWDLIEAELGSEVAQHLHIHYSRIEYTGKGEKEHVPNTNPTWGPKITPLFEFIKEREYTPIIINESPELEPDALLLQKEWDTFLV